jgi:hypothetical protein
MAVIVILLSAVLEDLIMDMISKDEYPHVV